MDTAGNIIISQLGEEVKDQSDEEVAEEEEGEGKGDSSQLYVPPKVVATPYGEYIGNILGLYPLLLCGVDEEEDGRSKARLKKRVKSAIVQELRNEYLDLPEEVNVSHMTCHAHSRSTVVYVGCWEWPEERQRDGGGERERNVSL